MKGMTMMMMMMKIKYSNIQRINFKVYVQCIDRRPEIKFITIKHIKYMYIRAFVLLCYFIFYIIFDKAFRKKKLLVIRFHIN